MSYEQIDRLNRINFYLEQQNNLLKNKLIEINSNNIVLKQNNNQLEKRVDKLLDTYRCTVCYKNPKNIILSDCFHFCLCFACLNKLDQCPICRKDIDLYHKIF
jgi:hypothetical protein